MKKVYFLSAILILIATMGAFAQAVRPINSDEALSLLKNNKKVVVLDVRTPGEFAQGHIKNAINIDVNSADAKSRIDALDKNVLYMVYCRTKNRSGVVTNYMLQNGFKNIYQVVDGIAGLAQQNLLVTN